MLIAAKVAGLLLQPPAIVLLIALIGLLLRMRWRTMGHLTIGLAFVALFAFSLPVIGHQLMMALESEIQPLPAMSRDTARRADAIVVLGGGRAADAAEYGGDTVSSLTLERLRYAAHLHRISHLPILVSGGAPFGEPVTEAELMRQTLERDFNVRPRWLEDQSRTTYENATYTRTILAGAGVRKVFVVTHAWHMRRAIWAFTQAGLEPIMAPTLLTTASATTALDYLPSAWGLAVSSRAISEWLGLQWYRLRYTLSPASATN